MDKFKNSSAGEAWFVFKHTGNIEDAKMLLEEMRQYDKAKASKQEELEM